MEDPNPELERFRQQWREEVSAKAQAGSKAPKASTRGSLKFPPVSQSSVGKAPKPSNDDDDHEPYQSIAALPGGRIEDAVHGGDDPLRKEPQSALEHYEAAVERENQGSLGDSLNLYRKAFRMDHAVDKKYKNKHFPPSSFPSKPTNPNPSNASATVPNPAHHSLHGPPQTLKELIASCAGVSIQPAPPLIEGMAAPPCSVSSLPREILVQVFKEVAVSDVASFVRLAQVCKHFAFMVLTEEQIWKRVCIGTEFGFGGMHFEWQREVLGGPLDDEILELQNLAIVESETPKEAPPILLTKEETTELLYSEYASSWLQMYRLRPRICFNGCYISTVNYMRPGQGSATQVTWHSPIHIVTYYRYLRFFRDGTAISLLTTDEPADVVRYLTKELQEAHRGGGSSHLPSAVMQNALRGRWRLSNITDNPEANMKDAEGDVYVETEGASKKYFYRMQLSLRSTGKAARNRKLTWQGFWSHNILTDDTAEFTLRNDKAFFFSRVKSYGAGA
ncbi:hypothetical protein HYFRA_00012309 [Hymenoscyphus fraxineus]|uniref:F-box domain-containing protein n=1 Tax=Hymenoscyphus fraxineus TaxID=746836 RepID=A0A9N9PKA3_9HELO|nr:hypothetical protein HYFRA_00012309 [Hymenoscyphus fraxineus]